MDFSWGPGAPGLPQPAMDPSLNLVGDHLLLDLDEQTLQCLLGGPSTSAIAGSLPGATGSEAGPSSKRPRTDEDCFAWLDGEGGGAMATAAAGAVRGGGGEDDEDGCDSGDDDSEKGKGKRIGKKGKPMSQQAMVKATREKARRERLNDGFDELARLCDPSGKMVKTDRVSIVTDAIRVMQQLRVENNQLRQLNKFLEERVTMYERERARTMYQQAMVQQQAQQMQQQQAQQMQQQQVQQAAGQLAVGSSGEIQPAVPVPTPVTAAAAPPMTQAPATAHMALPQGDCAAAAVMAAAPTAAAVPAEALLQAGPAAAALPPAAAPAMPAAAAATPAAVPGGLPPGATVALVQLPPGATLGATQLVGIKQEQLDGLAGMGMQPMLLPMGLPSALPPGAPPMSWFPAASLDATHDQKLRPPAA